MAVVTNTFRTTSAVGNRETLSDIVTRTDPEDTPIFSMISKESFEGIHPEWETDSLAAPANNVQVEGDDYAFGATTPAVRVGNYTQIMRKEGIISGTQDAVSNAGKLEQTKKQKIKKGIELRKDVEYSIVAANASLSGASRQSGSLSTWLTSNVSRGAGGANGGYSAGVTVAPTNGTQRAFTKTILDSVAQQGYQNGANFKHLFVSPYVKQVFVTFMSDANVASFRYAADSGTGNTIVANADIYDGPFGKLFVHPNRVMAGAAGLARNAFFIDPEYLKWGWLRSIAMDPDVAKTGDANKFVLLGEGALKPTNEKGLGVAADLYGLTAST